MNIPRLAAIRQRSATTEPTGSILLLVLVVVAALALGTGTYLQLMQTELRAVRYHGRGAQATRLAESAVEYLKVVLALPPAEVQLQGGLAANPTTMQAQLADDQPSDFDRGRFTVLAPAQADGRYAGVRFGLEDEAAKLNLNVLLAEGAEDQAQFRLLALPGMTPQIADAILDWLDPDDAPRPFGAERESYAQFDPPYEPRNGPIASLDELLLVRGVTPELLYGLDQNRNFFVDAGETARGVLTQIDNTEGLLNRGWSAYLTLNSVEAMAAALGGPVDVNGPDLQSLYNSLKTSLDDGEAKFIILYRQYGASNNNQQAGGEAGPRGRGSANQQNNQRPAERNGNSPAGNARNQGASVSAGSIELNFQQQGGAQINSLLDLVGAQVSVPSESQQSQNQNQNAGQNQENNGAPNNGPNQNRNQNQGPPQIVDSPWQDDAATHRDLLKLYDVARAGQADRIAGRVNVNQAPRVVLRSIPGMTAAVINQIVAVRELEPDRVLSEQRHVIWPLVQGFVTLDEMRQLERYITTRGDAFSGQVVGFFDAGRTSARGEFVLDRSGTQPRLRLWRDLSSWGPGFSPQLLGAQPASSQLQ